MQARRSFTCIHASRRSCPVTAHAKPPQKGNWWPADAAPGCTEAASQLWKEASSWAVTPHARSAPHAHHTGTRLHMILCASPHYVIYCLSSPSPPIAGAVRPNAHPRPSMQSSGKATTPTATQEQRRGSQAHVLDERGAHCNVVSCWARGRQALPGSLAIWQQRRGSRAHTAAVRRRNLGVRVQVKGQLWRNVGQAAVARPRQAP